jgi:DNA-binding GntR family transcriptional regulator
MSVSAATGVPRETVRRKIRWLIEQGWVQQVGRDKLFITSAAARHFKEFDVETVERFHAAAVQVLMTLQKRTAKAPTAPAAVTTAAPAPTPAARVATPAAPAAPTAPATTGARAAVAARTRADAT